MSLFPRARAPFLIALLCGRRPVRGARAAANRTGGAAFVSGPRRRRWRRPASGPVDSGSVARLLPDGTAAAPAGAPPRSSRRSGRRTSCRSSPTATAAGTPQFELRRRDCSGTVSFALHAAGLLKTPLDSGSFMRWGETGGPWITVYTNPATPTRDRGPAPRHERRRVAAHAKLRRQGAERGAALAPPAAPPRGF